MSKVQASTFTESALSDKVKNFLSRYKDKFGNYKYLDEIDETNNADSLMIEIVYPPLAPRHVMAMAGEAHVALYWETAVIPPPAPESLGSSVSGVNEIKSKPAVTFAPEILAKRDAARGSALAGRRGSWAPQHHLRAQLQRGLLRERARARREPAGPRERGLARDEYPL